MKKKILLAALLMLTLSACGSVSSSSSGTSITSSTSSETSSTPSSESSESSKPSSSTESSEPISSSTTPSSESSESSKPSSSAESSEPISSSTTPTPSSSSVAPVVLGLEVSGDFKKTYNVGESFDKTGMVVKEVYSDEHKVEIFDYTITPSGALSKANSTIRVSHGDFYEDVYITVNDVVSCTTLGLTPEVVLEAKTASAGKLYKFTKTFDIEAESEFKIKLMVNQEVFTYDFDELDTVNNLSGKEYKGDFVTLGNEEALKVNLKGNYTVYVNVANDKTATISFDVNDCEIPVIPFRDCYLVGEGSFATEPWTCAGGIKGTEVRDDPTAKEKYYFEVDFEISDKFDFHIDNTGIWYNYNNIKGLTNKSEVTEYTELTDFFKFNSSNDIIAKVKGNYSFYLIVWDNDTADIYIDVNSAVKPADVITLTTLGLTNEITFDPKTPEGDYVYKFENYSTYEVDDEFVLVLSVNDTQYTYGFDNIVEVNNEVDDKAYTFISEGADGAIHMNIKGGYTFYVSIDTLLDAHIWVSCYNYEKPIPTTFACQTYGLDTEVEFVKQDTASEGFDVTFKKSFKDFENAEFVITLDMDFDSYVAKFSQCSVVDLSGKDYKGDIFAAGTGGTIKVVLKGDYDFVVDAKYDGTIAVTIIANDYVVPEIEPTVIEMNTSGLGDEKAFTKEEVVTPGYKYEFNLTNAEIGEDAEFTVVLTLDDLSFTYTMNDVVDVNNLTDPYVDYDDMVVSGTNDAILVKGNAKLSINALVNTDKTAEITIDVLEFEIPDPTKKWDDLYFEGYGSYSTEDWSRTGGLKGEPLNNNPEAKEKYTITSEFKNGDVGAFELATKAGANIGWFNINDVKGAYDSSWGELTLSDYIVSLDNNIKFVKDGNYTFEVTVWANNSADINLIVNREGPLPPAVDPGCYVVSQWSEPVTKTPADDQGGTGDLLHKYEAYQWFWHDDIISITVADDKDVYEFKFADVKGQTVDPGVQGFSGNFLVEGQDGKIQIANNVNGGITFYISVWEGGYLDVYATLYSYSQP